MQAALKATTRTINSRTVLFRNLVITIVAVGLISVSWAVFQLSWRPLMAGFVLLVPLYGMFLCLDVRLIDHWQQQILQMWVQGHLDLKVFPEAMNTISTLPHSTLRGMLRTLPTPSPFISAIPATVRKALSTTLKTINRCQNDRMAAYLIGYTLGLACVAWAAMRWQPLPLVGLLCVPACLWVGHMATSLRLKRWQQRMREVFHQRRPYLQNFAQIAAQLDWEFIPTKTRDLLFKSLDDPHSAEPHRSMSS
jgi:hypothetical protein